MREERERARTRDTTSIPFLCRSESTYRRCIYISVPVVLGCTPAVAKERVSPHHTTLSFGAEGKAIRTTNYRSRVADTVAPARSRCVCCKSSYFPELEATQTGSDTGTPPRRAASLGGALEETGRRRRRKGRSRISFTPQALCPMLTFVNSSCVSAHILCTTLSTNDDRRPPHPCRYPFLLQFVLAWSPPSFPPACVCAREQYSV